MKHLISGLARSSAKSTPFLILCFSLGVIAIRFFPDLPESDWIAAFAILSYALLCRFRSAYFILSFVLGICWASWNAACFQAMMLPVSLEKKDVLVVGVISSLVKVEGNVSSFDFDVEGATHNQTPIAALGTIRLTSYQSISGFKSGDRWQLMTRLKRPRSLLNPGMGFDSAAWMYSKGINAKGYIVRGSTVRLSSDSFWSSVLKSKVNELRKGFALFLSVQSISDQQKAVFGALSVGVRDKIDRQIWHVLRDTGTAHLVAISGLHIGLVAMISGSLGGLLWRLTGRLRYRISKPAMRWIFGLGAALLYAMLAGFTLPTQRAAMMLILAAVMFLCRNRVAPGWFLSIALFVLLVANPLAPLSGSFWLSFIAVAVLIFSFRRGVTAHSDSDSLLKLSIGKLRKLVFGWVRLQAWLFVGMIPIFLLGFQQLSLVSPIANLLAVPVIGLLIVPLVLSALLCWCFGLLQLATIVLQLSAWLFELIWYPLSWLSYLTLSVWRQHLPTDAAVVVAVVGFVMLVFGRALPWRWLSIVWFLPLFFLPRTHLVEGQFRYSMLDVGQGLASVVQTKHHTLVFDTGAKYPSGFDMGESVVVPFLRARGVSTLDLLILSHGDNDHAGGAAAVVAEYEPKTILSGEPVSKNMREEVRYCRAGQNWRWDGVEFAVLWPVDDAKRSGNNASCVLRVSSKFGSVLLTGDVEESAERYLLKLGVDSLSSDLLQVPHHGSLTSSVPRLIRAVNPKLALNSSGYLNRFGHPHKTIVERYRRENVPLLTTAEHGAIEVLFDKKGIYVQSEKMREQKFWRDQTGSIEETRLFPHVETKPDDIISPG